MQAADIQPKEQTYYNRVVALKAQIAQGWTPAQVVAVMGEPERRGSYADGSDLVDIWGYWGYEVIIEFRNGLVSNWFSASCGEVGWDQTMKRALGSLVIGGGWLAYEFLHVRGYRNVVVLAGGFSEWVERGYPLETR